MNTVGPIQGYRSVNNFAWALIRLATLRAEMGLMACILAPMCGDQVVEWYRCRRLSVMRRLEPSINGVASVAAAT
jgi:hypothetical protein